MSENLGSRDKMQKLEAEYKQMSYEVEEQKKFAEDARHKLQEKMKEDIATSMMKKLGKVGAEVDPA
jgi:hypothetical protein